MEWGLLMFFCIVFLHRTGWIWRFCIFLSVRSLLSLEPFRFYLCAFWGWTVSLRLTYQKAIVGTERLICQWGEWLLDQFRLLVSGLDSVSGR